MKNKYTEDFEFQSLVQSALTDGLGGVEKAQLGDLLNNNMNAQAEYAFSEGLAKVLNHQDLFAIAGIVKQVIDTEGLPDMDNDVDNDVNSDVNNNVNVSPPPQYNTAIYAKSWFWVSLVALLVGFSSWGIWASLKAGTAQKNAEMAQQYIKPLEVNLFTTTPRQGIQNLKEGMNAYEAQDYAKASGLLRKYYDQSKDENGGLYLAISILLSNGSTQEAEDVLSNSMLQLAEPVKEVAEWYLIIAKLKANKKTEVILMLKKLPSSHLYKKEADRLLQQIE